MMQKADYELLRQVMDDALAPVKTDLANIKADVAELKDDLKDVYPKQVMDLKLEALKNETDAAKADAAEAKQLAGTFWQRNLERAALVATVGYSLFNLIGHFIIR